MNNRLFIFLLALALITFAYVGRVKPVQPTVLPAPRAMHEPGVRLSFRYPRGRILGDLRFDSNDKLAIIDWEFLPDEGESQRAEDTRTLNVFPYDVFVSDIDLRNKHLTFLGQRDGRWAMDGIKVSVPAFKGRSGVE